MQLAVQEKMLTDLHLSKESLLNEITLLLAKQQFAEYRMEKEYYEKKYGKSFEEFDPEFHRSEATLELEDDWMAWKFARESYIYWQKLLHQAQS